MHAFNRKRPLFMLALSVLLVGVAGCGAATTADGTTSGPGVSGTPTANAATTPTPPIGTPAPAASATPTTTAPGGTGVLMGATLGGTDAGFSAHYVAHGSGVYQQDTLLFNVYFGPGTDGATHADNIIASKIDASTWTADQALHICPQFNPPDAVHQSDAHDSQGDLVQIFTSQRLKQTFAASVFYPQTAGFFSIDYLRKPGESGVFQCVIHFGNRT
jgi:hypothetical protein